MKKVIAFFMVFAIIISGMISANAQTDDSVRDKKIVSIVYDDSGSMVGDSWVQANYAMQAFISMLNQGDELYITYMTNPYNSHKINTDNLSSAVERVRNHTDSSGTPIDSLKTGFETLKGNKDNNLNTQYWLVAFTDGGFYEADNIAVGKMLDNYSSTDMANGTKPNIFFMTINDINNTYTPSSSNKNVDIRSATSDVDIKNHIFSVASKISGRYSVDSKDIKVENDTTISVSADIPLLNIGILTQNTDVKVKSIKSEEGFEVPIKSDIKLAAPDESNQCVVGASEDSLKMHGNMILAGSDNENIPSGKYKIEFTDKINIDDLVIMFEPAISLRITLYRDGNEITDYNQIAEGEKNISAKAGLYEFGTNNEILSSLLPDGIQYSMVHYESGNEVESSDTLELSPLTISKELNTITATVELPGYFVLSETIEFTPVGFVCDRIEAELLFDGSERLEDSKGNPDGEDVVYLTRLDENRTGVKFTLYEEGKPIDKARALAIQEEFEKGLNVDFPFYKVEIQNDGGLLVYPTKTSFFYNPIIEFMFHNGLQNVEAEISGVSADKDLNFKLGDNWIGALLSIIIPIYLIWWIVFKKHLPRGSLTYYSGRVDFNSFDNDPYYREEDYIRTGWFGVIRNPLFILPKLIILLLPFASKVRFRGYTFIGQKNLIHRYNTQFIVKNVKNKAISETNPSPTSESIEAKTELDDKLYIKESEVTFSRFDFD